MTDWNDLHVNKGLDFVRTAINAALASAGDSNQPETTKELYLVKTRVEEIIESIPANCDDINEAIPAIAERCAKFKLSDLEISEIVEDIASRFKQPNKKTVISKTLKAAVRKYRSENFKRKAIKLGSIPLNEPVPKETFPHAFNDDGVVKLNTTVENLKHLLDSYGVCVEYDVIQKKEVITFPGDVSGGSTDLSNEAGIQRIRSLASNSGLSMTAVEFLPVLLDQNPRNHFLEWVLSVPHDGVDRISELAKTVTVVGDAANIWPAVLKLWLTQTVAAADAGEHTPRNDALPKFESVLVLVGSQGKLKTSWIGGLLPEKLKKYFADGLHLRVGNRDSEKISISFLIVELGELDATFRKSDVAALKAFLSRQFDTMRTSYARRECSFKRRTSFIASVNSREFLTDSTGNRRFWPVEVDSIRLSRELDLQQLWRQVWDGYVAGWPWWADSDIESELVKIQEDHTEICSVYDSLASFFSLEPEPEDDKFKMHLSCKEIASACSIEATQKNSNKIGAIMRKHGFKKKIVNGKAGYKMGKRKASAH